MPEPDDELEALRVADPLDPASLPSPADPRAQALFERITMTDITTTPPSPARGPRANQRRLIWAAAAAAVVGLAGGAIALALQDDSDPPTASDIAADPTEATLPTESTDPTDPTQSDPITSGGPIAGSCVELYDLHTLINRETAFDGTVSSIASDSVTFAVNQWYRGGDSTEITLNGATGLSGLTSAGPAVALEPGARLLVAGDGGFAWACGFSQPYDPAVADQWQQAFGG